MIREPKPLAADDTRIVSVRLRHEDADLFEARAAASVGGSKSKYLVALLRSRKTPEHDLRDVSTLASATASVWALTHELQAVRNGMSEGFGLMKQAFVSEPDKARESKAAIDDACVIAKAVIREAERVMERVAKAAAGPLDDLADAASAIRTGRA